MLCRTDLVGEQLGQAVGEPVQQLRTGVGLAVPRRVERGVLEPEVGGEVHDVRHPLHERRHQRLGGAVRQATEDEVDAVEQIRVP